MPNAPQRPWTVTPNTTTRIVAGLFRSRNFIWNSDSRVAARFGVSWTQFLVLRALRFTNADFTMSPTQLYEATQASSSGMAKMLKGLTDQGLVERLPNPQDARSTLVRLLPKGADLVEDIIDQFGGNEHRTVCWCPVGRGAGKTGGFA